jgi:hypothetical protein
MARLRPIKRKDLISSLRQLDFTGPYAGGKHEYMQLGRLKVRIPNPHQGQEPPSKDRGLVSGDALVPSLTSPVS